MKLVFSVAILVFLLLPIQVFAQQTTEPAIDIGQSRWNKSTLKVLIALNESESWWQTYYPDMTVRAIEQWNDAIIFFADKYPEYSYLADVQMTTYSSNVTLPGYDIYIVFDPNVLISGVDALGEALVESYLNKTIKYATITISTKSQVVDLTQQVYRDTTTHELGHALGLGHSNYSNDLMYPYQDIVASNYSISTLDLFGVALLFQWMSQTNLTKNQRLSTPSSTTLPYGIDYEYAPINNPAPTSLNDNPVIRLLWTLLLNPITLSLIITMIFVFVLLVVTLLRRARWKRQMRRKMY